MEDRIIYSISGLKGMELSCSEQYFINSDILDSFCISTKLDEMIVLTKRGVRFFDYEDKINRIAKNIFLNLTIEDNTEIYCPEISIKSINGHNLNIQQYQNARIDVNLTVVKGNNNGQFFKHLIQTNNPLEAEIDIYDNIIALLKNSNIVIQFVGLYELMKNTKTQKQLSTYLNGKKEKYEIKFYDTKKEGYDYKEDEFTYIRNDISHIERENDLEKYKKLGSDIDQSVIKKMIRIICEM